MATLTIRYLADFPGPNTPSYTDSNGVTYYGASDRIREERTIDIVIPDADALPFCESGDSSLSIGFGPCITNMGVSPGCTAVLIGHDDQGTAWYEYVDGDTGPYITNDNEDYLDLNAYVTPEMMVGGLSPELLYASLSCEEGEKVVAKIWNTSIPLTAGDTTIALWNQLIPPPDLNHYIQWQATIQITAFDAKYIDWVEANPKMYKFGSVSQQYFGRVGERALLTAIDNYFGLFETLPTIQPVSTVAPGTVTFGQRLTPRARCNGFGINLRSTVSAQLNIHAMQIYSDMAEYI